MTLKFDAKMDERVRWIKNEKKMMKHGHRHG